MKLAVAVTAVSVIHFVKLAVAGKVITFVKLAVAVTAVSVIHFVKLAVAGRSTNFSEVGSSSNSRISNTFCEAGSSR